MPTAFKATRAGKIPHPTRPRNPVSRPTNHNHQIQALGDRLYLYAIQLA